jgi:alkaline phosphatase D
MPVSRRAFLTGAAACLAAPEFVRAQVAPDDMQLFRHGVASGDPLADRVVLWTRLTEPATRSARGSPIEMRWRIATDDRLTRVVARGDTVATAERDFTVKVDAGGLQPGRTYFYAFEAGGQMSPMGRTRTLAPRGAARVRLAAVSCSNYGTGYFNVYRCLAERDDLDLVVHLGDYIYESANGIYGEGPAGGRIRQQPRSDVTLADYRLRYAAYRSDIDLQEAHARHPFVAVWDDHELADNAWAGGAAGHEKNAGPWPARQAAAYRAYLEWMPVRESAGGGIRLFRSFRIGDMADLLMLDTRGMRSRQLAAEDVARLDSGERSLLGAGQERWLFDQLRRSQRDGTRWRIIGQQIMFSSLNPPGSPVNPDFWEGYPAARRRVLDLLSKERTTNVAILAGDLHSSWALDVPADPWSGRSTDGRSLAVELVTPAISSPPLFAEAGMRERMTQLQRRAPHLKFLDGDQNGYVLIDLARDRLRADWVFVPSVAERTDRESTGASFVCEAGSSRLSAVSAGTP